MKLLATALSFILTLSGTTAFACSQDGKEGFLPENGLYIPVGMKGIKVGLVEFQFNNVVDQVETIYSPIASNLGKKLIINRNWYDGVVNANASADGNQWTVNMYGGLARHEAITEDGFALVLCHEVGHLLGGAPKKVQNWWASNEGQADYWATLKCLRKVFLNDNNGVIVKRLNAPKAVVDGCTSAWKNREDRAICIRSAMAGASVANLFSSLKLQKNSDFATPDAKVVSMTDDNHPATQCRLDTYFQGALCEEHFSDDVSQRDEKVGTCNKSTGHAKGLRPLCWFKPKY